MRTLIQAFIVISVSLTLIGCATTNEYSYIPPQDSSSATLVGKDFMVFIPQSKIRVRFYEIDGKEIMPDGFKGIPSEVPVSPGLRKVTVYLEAFGFVTAQETIEIKVDAEKRYIFEPRNIGQDFDLVVREEGSERVVFSKRIKGSQGSNPSPIFIPIYN